MNCDDDSVQSIEFREVAEVFENDEDILMEPEEESESESDKDSGHSEPDSSMFEDDEDL